MKPYADGNKRRLVFYDRGLDSRRDVFDSQGNLVAQAGLGLTLDLPMIRVSIFDAC